MTSSRRLVSSGSPLEPEIGMSRAVRLGPYICVAGTAPIAEGGGTAAGYHRHGGIMQYVLRSLR